MAYFSNGDQGEYYESKYCQQCIHYGKSGESCAVLALHIDWNYEACNGYKPNASPEEKVKFIALDTLWPIDSDGRNGQCAMFVKKKHINKKEKSNG